MSEPETQRLKLGFNQAQEMKQVFSILLYTFALTCLVSCGERPAQHFNKSVTFHRYDIYDKELIKESKAFFMDQLIREDSFIYSYKYEKNPDKGIVFQFSRAINNTVTLSLFETPCPLLVGQKNFRVNKKTYTVYRYYYDIERSSDEETSYYFCDPYGLLVVINDTFYGLNYTVEYDSVSNEIVSHILADQSEFTEMIES